MSSPVTADIFFRTDTKTDHDYPVLGEERGEEEDRAVRRLVFIGLLGLFSGLESRRRTRDVR